MFRTIRARPRIEPVSERLRVEFAGVTIADTTRAFRILETHHAPTYYIPPEDVLMAALVPTERRDVLRVEGQGHLFRHRTQCAPVEKCRLGLWQRPLRGIEALKDHLSFYATSVDAAYVGDLRVTPQPGDFYGGWVTPNLTGKIKGAAGTMHW
jgi:uncharacterized protein (DUF427 family)